MQNLSIPFTFEDRVSNGVSTSNHVAEATKKEANSSDSVVQSRISLQILGYLIYEGYADTALNMAKELGLEGIAGRLERTVSRGNGNGDDMNVDRGGIAQDNAKESKVEESIAEEDSTKDHPFSCDDMFKPETLEKKALEQSGNLFSQGSPIFVEITEEEYKRLTYGVDSIKTRGEVRRYLLEGMPDKASELIGQEYPTLLELNSFVYFKLTQMQLIEMIKGHWRQIEKITDPKKSEKCERQFLDDVTGFIGEKLSAPTILESRDFLIEVEKTVTLLCYGQELRKPKESRKPIPRVLQRLLSQKMRQEVATLVNKAILLHQSGVPDEDSFVRFDTKLETLYRKTPTVLTVEKQPIDEERKPDTSEDETARKAASCKTRRQIEEMNSMEMLLRKAPGSKLESTMRLLLWYCNYHRYRDNAGNRYVVSDDLTHALTNIFQKLPDKKEIPDDLFTDDEA